MWVWIYQESGETNILLANTHIIRASFFGFFTALFYLCQISFVPFFLVQTPHRQLLAFALSFAERPLYYLVNLLLGTYFIPILFATHSGRQYLLFLFQLHFFSGTLGWVYFLLNLLQCLQVTLVS